MKNMESEKFEESWKDAFQKAEVNPSEGVWTNIELGLEKSRGGALKRRLMFYQMLAAASVVFAMAIGGVGYYFNFHQNRTGHDPLARENSPAAGESILHAEGDQAAEENQHTAASAEANSAPVAEENSGKITTEHSRASAFPQADAGQRRNVRGAEVRRSAQGDGSDGLGRGHEPSVGLATNHPDDIGRLPRDIDERNLPPLYTARDIALPLHRQQVEGVDPVVAMLARLERREREVQGEEKDKKSSDTNENLWTSVGFAAGSFNNIAGASSPAPTTGLMNSSSLAAPIVDQESKASGYAYSMGVNMGTRISERWVLQGGVNYLTQSSEYTANNVVLASSNYQMQRFRAATPNEVIHADEQELASKLVHSAPYNVNNSMRYLSIPMQAGYLLVNKTFGLQVNAGVATDLFLQNTIKADSDQLDKTSQPGGADSPYRSFNLSGLLGTEVSYRFNQSYRISLNPGIRYPFNTIYKSELGVRSTPLTFDVGLRFRYIFH